MTRLCGALLVGMLSLGWPAPAAATPGQGVQGRVLVQSTGDGQDFVTNELTIAPGGRTGWHWHPGPDHAVHR